MAYYPNESAIIWFLKNCFELIRNSVPEVRLKIVGINPSNNVKRFHDDERILVTGFVESIINEIITSQVAIAPMQSGYGMHIKILEAMSCGLPVVSTSSGLGTIEAISGTDVLIADDPVSFSNHCVSLLQNHEKAQDIGIAARKLIVEKYSWETHACKLENIYLTAIGQFRTATQSSYGSGRDKPV
jgi:glycosyltransferase involved in cell wall biosynthesis